MDFRSRGYEAATATANREAAIQAGRYVQILQRLALAVMAERRGSKMTKNKPFKQTQIRTRYRGWVLVADNHSITGKKGIESFVIGKAPNIEEALRLGKAKVNRIEGEEIWTH